MSNELKEGDIIELNESHTVYANIPEHFAYSNKKGIFKLTHHAASLKGDLNYLCGKYVVIKTTSDGGGTGHGPNDVYPNGHHVFCRKIPNGKSYEDNLKVEHEVDFYQSGCFTAMITNIKPIGIATLKWTVSESELEKKEE